MSTGRTGQLGGTPWTSRRGDADGTAMNQTINQWVFFPFYFSQLFFLFILLSSSPFSLSLLRPISPSPSRPLAPNLDSPLALSLNSPPHALPPLSLPPFILLNPSSLPLLSATRIFFLGRSINYFGKILERIYVVLGNTVYKGWFIQYIQYQNTYKQQQKT